MLQEPANLLIFLEVWRLSRAFGRKLFASQELPMETACFPESRTRMVWILLLASIFPFRVSAQDADTPTSPQSAMPATPARRPRIGLALSGGAALGLSEIGVIQWMEEKPIPVDRI